MLQGATFFSFFTYNYLNPIVHTCCDSSLMRLLVLNTPEDLSTCMNNATHLLFTGTSSHPTYYLMRASMPRYDSALRGYLSVSFLACFHVAYLDLQVSDFGLAILSSDVLGGRTVELQGTFGYVAPEYLLDGIN